MSATFIVGVGGGGLAIQNSGSGWNQQTVGDGTATLFGVAGASATDIWAVGDTTFAHWDGLSWSPVPLPAGSNGTRYYAVWVDRSGEGWAVGEAGIYAHLIAGAWTLAGHGSNFAFYGVWGSSTKDVYVVGHGHSLATANPLFINHYDGNSWTDVSAAADPDQVMPALNAVWGSDASHVWAVGENGNVIFWNGSNWTALLTGAGTTESLKAVWGSGPRDVWVAGSAGVRHFNGTAWSQIPGLSSPTTIWLSAN